MRWFGSAALARFISLGFDFGQTRSNPWSNSHEPQLNQIKLDFCTAGGAAGEAHGQLSVRPADRMAAAAVAWPAGCGRLLGGGDLSKQHAALVRDHDSV